MKNEVRPIDANALARKILLTCNNVATGDPLTQADLDKMDFEKVWISYGPEPDNGEEALVYHGQIYCIDTLEGAGFEEMLHDLIDGETLDNPSGLYRVYRVTLKGLTNTLPDSPLTMEQLRRMDGKPAYWPEIESWGIISVESAGKWAGIPFFCGRKLGVNFQYNIESRGMEVYAYPPPTDQGNLG